MAMGSEVHQQIRFCRSDDGTRIAHARHGSGPPLVVVACWLSHLQHDWQSPVWRHFLDDLGAFTTLIRYDLRGHGLSDWSVDDFSMEAHLADLEAVVSAQGLDRFALMGMSGYSTVALAYAARHPERITRVVLYGGWPGFRQEMTDDDRLAEDAWLAMIQAGWTRPDPTFRRVLTQQFIPGASEQQMRWFDDLQRMSASTENVIAARKVRRHFDVRDQLEQIRAPTLVLHAIGDHAVSFEFGREVATGLPDARLVPLQSENHILLADEPAWTAFRDELRDFMRPDRERATTATPGLSELTAREREVLHLAADGRTNAEIAQALVLSVRTVERHLSNAYAKLGIGGKAARTAAVANLLRRPD
jgi:pimeloyl-ACP methyl ester carboxylesterase/DNA-binding CsgD family transcriptional regulator